MNDNAQPLQVALIGYGFVGKAFHAPLINAVPGLALSVVASRDAAKVHADLPHVRVIADPLEAIRLPEVDLVVIASPNATHAPLALAALEAGKHVVVDKPFTLDLAQARTLIAAAEKHGRLLSVFQNRRWDSDFLGVKQVIEQGLIGKVTHFESHIDRYRPRSAGALARAESAGQRAVVRSGAAHGRSGAAAVRFAAQRAGQHRHAARQCADQ